MDAIVLFQRLGLALAIGLLIGLERGWRERELDAGTRAAGIRTFALAGFLGGIWGALTPMLGPVPLAAAGIAFAAAFTLFEWREGVARNDFSVTTTIAGMVVFALGAFAVLGNPTVAVAAGVAVMALLAARANLHEFVRRLTWPELRSAVVLLVMTFLLLPILPDRPVDPWEAINPYELWVMVVLIAALAFGGYVAVRILGADRGLMVSAAVGSLISSTTVTLNASRLAAKGDAAHSSLGLSICVAWIVSLARMTAIAIAVNPLLFRTLLGPIASAIMVLAIAGVFYWRSSVNENLSEKSEFRNPLDLPFVLGFGALLAVITIASKLLGDAFGSSGVLTLAGLSGFVDVDPITLSSARLAGSTLTLDGATDAILLAAVANMTTKISAAVLVGGAKFGWKLVLAGMLALIMGALVWWLKGIG